MMSYVGDTILMEYQKTILQTEVKDILIKHSEGKVEQRNRCDFAIDQQKISEVAKHTHILLEANHKINKRVVLMIGTYDVLAYTQGLSTNLQMVEDLQQLIQYLWDLKVIEIILCTLLRSPIMSVGQKHTVNTCNAYIKSWNGIHAVDRIITVVDTYFVIDDKSLFQSDGILPFKYAYQKIHEALQDVL